MDTPEILLDLILADMNGRRDNVARVLAAQLDDVFAEIGLDRLDAGGFEEVVELDLLGEHRFALGHRAGVVHAADVEDDAAGLGRGLGPVNLATGFLDLLFISFEIDVEMAKDMVLDGLCVVAQLVEFGQCLGGRRPSADEARPDLVDRLLELAIPQCVVRICLEGRGGNLHRVLLSPDRRLIGHAGQHLGDVANLDIRSLPLQLASHVHQAAKVAGKQHVSP